MHQLPNNPNQIVFCEKPWRLPALFLGAATLFTFIWGFYILTHFLNAYDLEDYSISAVDGGMAGMAGMTPIASGQDLTRLVAPSVVTISPKPEVVGSAVPFVSSGTLVSSSGHIFTTLHSIKGLDEINVIVETATARRSYKAEVVKTHAAHDLVLLKLITNDRFLYLTLADTRNLPTPTEAVAFGREGGAILVRPGTVALRGQNLTVGSTTMTHLLKVDAKVAWTQNGGPLINNAAELLGLNIVVDNGGNLFAYAVPAHVLMAHFQDVVNLKPANKGRPATASIEPLSSTNDLSGKATGIAVAWWNRARDMHSQGSTINTTPPDQTKVMQQHRDAQRAASGLTPPMTGFNGLAIPVVANTPTSTPAASAAGVNHKGSAGDKVSLLDLEHESGFLIGTYKLDAMLGLTLLALMGGFVGALMPMGGSILIVTGMMLFFSYGLHLIRPAIYVANLFTYGVSAARMLSQGLVMRHTLLPLLPWVIGGVLIGYFVGHNLPDHFVGYLLGIFALAMGGAALYELYGPLPRNTPDIITPANSERTQAMNAFIDNLDLDNARRETAFDKLIMGTPLGLLTGTLGV
ncbi:MAG: TSUP family transporter, partial [Gammaproteobacteria bacterium]|nr:TSUP family transporter [Gammaproteobacteria bacterium]